MNRILYLAAYDIREPKRLQKMLYVLKDYSSGGQKSVFECYLFNHEKRELVTRVKMVMDENVDAFLLVRLNKQNDVKTLGMAVKPLDELFTYLG